MAPKQITYTALFLSLTIVLPIAFHQAGLMGRIFLPMHIPVLVCGFLLGWAPALFIGLVSPFLSHMLTGMPPTYAVPLMTLELALYGTIAGLTFKKLHLNIYISLIVAMIFGRLAFALGLILLALFIELPYGPIEFLTGGIIITGWPGLILQFIAIPPLVAALKRRFEVNR